MSKMIKISAIKANDNNPRFVRDAKFDLLVKSIERFPEMMSKRPMVCVTDEDGKLHPLGGNMRFRALQKLGYKEIPAEWIIMADDWSEEQRNEFMIKDNVSVGEWDMDVLANEWDSSQLEEWGLVVNNYTEDLEQQEQMEKETEARAKLTDSFLVPPFSVLDSRQGYWLERKRNWKTLIQDNGETREETLAKGSMMSKMNNGVSILDPVLAEIANLWFGIPNGNTFDCFAGDSVFGYVAAHMGSYFTGIELRKEQAELNNKRIQGMTGKYICDDGRNVLNHIAENSQDLLFSCPPYFDLEVYSDLENDASNQETYEDFIKILDDAFTAATKCLKNNRFAVITVGDVRDKKGFYYRFVDDIKDIFKRAGMPLYNELIIVESIGTLPQRVGRTMEHRKVGKCHQNVLVFFKGNPKEIKGIYPKLNLNIPEEIIET